MSKKVQLIYLVSRDSRDLIVEFCLDLSRVDDVLDPGDGQRGLRYIRSYHA